ncbi:MAG: phosphoribosylformylglycinamidine cyclo-ligase [Phycisphaerales bacterium]|nr:phosphoribosylformylglycinamidine cyclo-ligase [Phycisphaerales bacterium]MCB9857126.1 phosphoribosylformylglycinamidine cyclo-ligase [Phycisphaerales bacterium]MCB9861747.1 phosphoribosylformylglycinamidine cyclo-ligase [Phycisphaerales bacterium]
MAKRAGKLTYKSSGVDVSANDVMVDKIGAALRRTYDPRVISRHGGFAGLMRLDYHERLLKRCYREPVLVAGADGVGSKLLFGIQHQRIASLGIDLVAMSVNDILTVGAEPLMFLDYVACHKLKPAEIAEIVTGVSTGCVEAGCALLGGETAEMPAMYSPSHFDLAGFCVGVVERDRIIDGDDVEPGDVVIGLASSGIHSNGYSLVHAAIERLGKRKQLPVDLGEPLEDALLRPTRIYVQPVLKLLRSYRRKKIVRAMAHITGGGIAGNLPRVLPDGCAAHIHRGAWTPPPVFRLIQALGVDESEMYDVFNMGIGFILVVRPAFANAVIERLNSAGETAFRIGTIRKGKRRVVWR